MSPASALFGAVGDDQCPGLNRSGLEERFGFREPGGFHNDVGTPDASAPIVWCKGTQAQFLFKPSHEAGAACRSP